MIPEFIVGINLTRLNSNSGGGAGLFGISMVREAAKRYRTSVFVQYSNMADIRRRVGDVDGLQYIPLDFSNGVDRAFEPHLDDLDVFIDPLNGLEPSRLPRHVFTVPVIHDLLFVDRPYFFSQEEIDFRRSHYGDAIDRADHVWTVSDQQAEKIRNVFGKAAVSAIIQPPHFSFGDQEAVTLDAGRRFVLYPAVQWNHKNHFRLFQAFARLCSQGLIPDDVDLIFTGVFPKEANSGLHLDLLAQLNMEDRIKHVAYMQEGQYAAVLRAAIGVVYPSLYEGWGVPVCEAAVNGVPILTADCPSLSVARDAENVRILPTPEDADVLAAALADFINEPPPVMPPVDASAAREAFGKQVAEVCEKARHLRRGSKDRRESSDTHWPDVKRREAGNTLVVVSVSSPSEELYSQIRDAMSASPGLRAVVLAPYGGERPPEGIGRAAYASPAERDLALTYEVVFARTTHITILADGFLTEAGPSVLAKATAVANLYHDLVAVLLTSEHDARISGDLGAALSGCTFKVESLGSFELTPGGLTRAALRAREDATRIARPRLVIIDPSLKDLVGHHSAVARSLARGARENGCTPIVLGNRACPQNLIEPDALAVGAFDDYLYSGVNNIGLFTYELEVAAKRVAIMGDDVVTLFCATPTMLAGTIPFLLARKMEDRPTISIRFDRDEARAPSSRISYRRAFELIRLFGLRGHYRFFAESKGLQKYFEDLAGETMPLLFNPLPKADVSGLKFIPTGGDNKRLCLSYLGEARVEKGFHVVPFAIEYLLSLPDLADKICFFIQTGAGPLNQHGWVLSAQADIERRAAEDARIQTRRFLSETEYADAVERTDIMLLPYGPPDYTRRGSGVATETVAASKVMACSQGLDLADTFEGAGVVLPDNQSEMGLARAFEKAIREYPAFKAKAQMYRKRNDHLFGDDAHFVRRLTDEGQAASAPFKPVIWLSNDTRGEGSGVVYDSQIKYLESTGHAVFKVVVPYPSRWAAENPRDFDWAAFLEDLEVFPAFKLDSEMQQVITAVENEGNSYQNFSAAWKKLIFPSGFQNMVNAFENPTAVINYAHHAHALEKLSPNNDMVRICEAHDIQAYQYALQQLRSPTQVEIDEELNELSKFDHVVSISAKEARMMSGVLSDGRVTWRLPFIDERPNVANVRADGEDQLIQETDLLIVGSRHDANVASARWFIHNVYKTMLYDRGITLRVVGTIVEGLDSGYLSDKIDYCGWVPCLDKYYAKSRIAVLPIVAGAGVPIKVLDAFARGVPFSLTEFPREAIGLPADFPTCHGAVAMGADIASLLSSGEARRERAKLGRQFYETFASRSSYFRSWDSIMAKAQENRR
ncbi:glycosyltransferase [Brevundimonas sp. 'scallop']|uniref:glycosyltransferase n=1 Tax=Brevundimonas sp. 'scallop' TaxID=2562582 RepID=UPI0013E0FAF6|nr:glycosyltransferase [Brevundimonas sp. 'scallop']QIF80623.1 glycosyltransferase [Brevundimonas sp. 'scallop']